MAHEHKPAPPSTACMQHEKVNVKMKKRMGLVECYPNSCSSITFPDNKENKTTSLYAIMGKP